MRKSKRIIKGSFLKEFVDTTFLQSYPVISDRKMTLVKNKLSIEYSMDNYIEYSYHQGWGPSYGPKIECYIMESDFEYSTYFNSDKKRISVCYSGYREYYMKSSLTENNSIEGVPE